MTILKCGLVFVKCLWEERLSSWAGSQIEMLSGRVLAYCVSSLAAWWRGTSVEEACLLSSAVTEWVHLKFNLLSIQYLLELCITYLHVVHSNAAFEPNRLFMRVSYTRIRL